MPLPETILVNYTEDRAGYLEMRPVVKQTFRAAELVDMIVQVAGKDPARVRQILGSGTVHYRSFRYGWEALQVEPAELQPILAAYPDSEPERPFAQERCTEVVLESSGSPPRHSLRIERDEAARKSGLRARFRAGNFWDALMSFAAAPGKLHYREYSYAKKADVYSVALTPAQVAQLASEANQLASRQLRIELRGLPSVSQIVFCCPR